ncbi:MAG: 2-hydroxyacyl-CoA dehydratase [Sellimonas intestinalis]
MDFAERQKSRFKRLQKDLPKNLCPLIQSSYGFAKTDTCPYFYFSDLVVGETTCDGKKKMFEFLGRIKDVHVMHLPNVQDEAGKVLWKGEILRLKERLEEKFGISISDESVRLAVRKNNQIRKALKGILWADETGPGSDVRL